MTPFDVAWNFTRAREGGFGNDPKDSGGPTNLGITQAVYDKWNAMAGRPPVPVQAIIPEDAAAIARNLYWLPAGCDRYVDRLAMVVFDAAFHHGVSLSVGWLQRALWVEPDGVAGIKTCSQAVYRDWRLTAHACLTLRREFMLERAHAGVPIFVQNLKGFLARVDLLRETVYPRREVTT